MQDSEVKPWHAASQAGWGRCRPAARRISQSIRQISHPHPSHSLVSVHRAVIAWRSRGGRDVEQLADATQGQYVRYVRGRHRVYACHISIAVAVTGRLQWW